MSATVDQKKVIGENIKAARKIKGLSQRSLAEKLGIAFQNLSVWENGKGAPSAKYLMKLSEILAISLDQLTSPEGVKASLEKSFSGEGKFTGLPAAQSSVSDSDLQKMLETEIPRFIQRELAENHSLKLIIRYLEEVLSMLKASGSIPGLRAVADSQDTQYGRSGQRAPIPTGAMSNKARLIWERNAAMLQQWLETEQAFWVPEWALEKFCRQAEVDPLSSNLEDVSRAVKECLESGKTK
jgi:transcriptional regulator with XRE-family HTH domain